VSWLRRETVVRQRPGSATDGHGNTVPDWTDPAELTIDGCLVAPGNTAEEQSQGDTVTSGFTVYAPSDVDVAATDGVVVRGTRYLVLGEPARWPPGTVIVLTRTEG
jgi:hypothetical protein